MKFCSNLKDTMYFLSFRLRQNKGGGGGGGGGGGRGQEGNGTCLYFPLGVILNFEVNYYSFFIL